MEAHMKIGELARQTRCPVETIRFYEKEGILPSPPRSSGNYRLYGRLHVDRLLFVRRCRSFDMSLDEIKRLLQVRDTPQDDCTTVSAFLDEHIEQVALRIAELEHLKEQLKALRQRCSGARTAEQCGILQELGASELNPD